MAEKGLSDVSNEEIGSHDAISQQGRERANRNLGSKRAFFSWSDPNDGPSERRLILKLDFFILTYAFIGFWVCILSRCSRS
jgi:hypothetical protein